MFTFCICGWRYIWAKREYDETLSLPELYYWRKIVLIIDFHKLEG